MQGEHASEGRAGVSMQGEHASKGRADGAAEVARVRGRCVCGAAAARVVTDSLHTALARFPALPPPPLTAALGPCTDAAMRQLERQ